MSPKSIIQCCNPLNGVKHKKVPYSKLRAVTKSDIKKFCKYKELSLFDKICTSCRTVKINVNKCLSNADMPKTKSLNENNEEYSEEYGENFGEEYDVESDEENEKEYDQASKRKSKASKASPIS